MEIPRAVFLYNPEQERYSYPEGVPLTTGRASRARAILASMGLLVGDDRQELSYQPAPREALERFHTGDYLDVLRKGSDGVFDPAFIQVGMGLPDCPLFAGMYEYAALAAGATLKGADLILAGEAGVVFNPSGGYHHAGPAMAAGFCYINDVVLACQRIADAGKRALFLDIDVHHGDGAQDAFYRRSDVMTVSFHESGQTLYPGTGFEDEIGEGPGRGFSVNLPLPVGTYDGAYLSAFDRVVLPLTEAFRPDVIVTQIGLDGLAGDPLAHLNLTNNVFADMITRLLSTGVPLLATGGGGYHPENTARGWALCWAALTGEAPDEDLAIGLGGVMLESTDWLGGLRDRPSLLHGGQRKSIDEAIELSVRRIHETVFPLHGITLPAATD